MFIYIIYLFIYVSICLYIYIYRGIVEVLSCRMVMGYRKAPPASYGCWSIFTHPTADISTTDPRFDYGFMAATSIINAVNHG